MKTKRSFLIIYIWLFVFSIFTYAELFFGASNNIVLNKYWLHNIMICFLINVLVFHLIKKKWSLLLVSCISFVWSTVSHFVLQLHGSALCFSLFKNFKTAVSVLNHYQISFDLRVIKNIYDNEETGDAWNQYLFAEYRRLTN